MKPKSKEEMLKTFIEQVDSIAWYWSQLEGKTDRERCDGVAFSIMNIFDGTCGGFPCAVDLVLRPHPDDKAYCVENEESYVEDGMVINDEACLHELLCKGE